MPNQPIPVTKKKTYLPAVGSIIESEAPAIAWNDDVPERFCNCAPVKIGVAGTDPRWQVVPRITRTDTGFGDLASSTDSRAWRGSFCSNDGTIIIVIGDLVYSGTLAGGINAMTMATGTDSDGDTLSTTLSSTVGDVQILETEFFWVLLERGTSVIHQIRKNQVASKYEMKSHTFTFVVAGYMVYYETRIYISEKSNTDDVASETIWASDQITERSIVAASGADPWSQITANIFRAAYQREDPIQHLAVHRDHLVVFGTKTIEFFYIGNYSEGFSQLERNKNYFVEIGVPNWAAGDLAANTLIKKVDDVIYFIGRSNSGQLSVYQLQDFKVSRISSAYIDQFINFWVISYGNADALDLSTFRSFNTDCLMLSWSDATTNFIATNGAGEKISPFCYIPSSNIWTKLDFPTWTDASGDVRSLYRMARSFSDINGRMILPFIYDDGVTPTYTFSIVEYVSQKEGNKTGGSSILYETLSSTINPPITDFNNYNYKHFQILDIVGTFTKNVEGANEYTQVKLEKSFDTDIEGDWDLVGTRSGDELTKDHIRYWNIGRSKRLALKYTVDSKYPWALDGAYLEYEDGNS